MTEEHKRKISIANKGKPRPWLRGKPSGNKGKHHKHTPQAIEKIRIAKLGKPRPYFMGSGNPNWKGGLSFKPYSIDWTYTLKKSIRERDHYICQLCFKDGFPVHHIDYNKGNCNPDNLITLCHRCNSIVNFNREKWSIFFKNKYLNQLLK